MHYVTAPLTNQANPLVEYLYDTLRGEYSGTKKNLMREATHETNSRFLLFAILFSVTVSVGCLIVVKHFSFAKVGTISLIVNLLITKLTFSLTS